MGPLGTAGPAGNLRQICKHRQAELELGARHGDKHLDQCQRGCPDEHVQIRRHVDPPPRRGGTAISFRAVGVSRSRIEHRRVAGELVGALVLGMAGYGPSPNAIRPGAGAAASTSSCHSSAFLTGFRSAVCQPFRAPAVDPFGDAVADIDCCRCRARPGTAASAPRAPRIAASSSIRLLVVSGSPPDNLLLARPRRIARPSRPGRDCPCRRRR